MGRFYSNLKQKTIAGDTSPTSAQLRDTGQTIFIESRNQSDLGELILVQKANILQHQNGRLQHPGLSEIKETAISDSGVPADVEPVPKFFEVFEVCLLSVKNTSGGTASVTIALTDGTTSVPLISGLSVTNGSTSILVSPLAFDGSTSNTNSPFTIDSSLYLMASSDASVTVQVGYRTMSVK
tara:strand:+ start:159 stop:704 length:546 start_codon:yes stop_codon:yes gene_type:complete